MYSIQDYAIKFISDLRQVDGFLRVLRFPPQNKIDRYNITEILLKVALSTIKPNLTKKKKIRWNDDDGDDVRFVLDQHT